MKRKIAAAAALATVLTAAACSSSSSGSGTKSQALLSTDGKGKTVTVWLMQDAQKGWPDVVNAAVKQFKDETGAEVKIEWQNWPNYGTKLDTALLSGNAPDALELGNTQTGKYIASGAFVDLTSVKSKFDNSAQWLDSLAASGESADHSKTYAIPYYAGVRTVLYRKDLFAAAGVTSTPKTLDEFKTDLDKVKAKNANVPNFSALYLPGKNWYAALSFGAAYMSDPSKVIASSDGSKWTGTLTDPGFVKGIQTWDDFQKNYSVGGTTVDESDQDARMAKGNIAAIVANGWELSSVIDPKVGDPKLADKLGTFALPGATADSPAPAFLGGSDLAVPTHAANPGLGAEFLRIFTNTAQQTALAKFAIPNNKTLLSAYKAASPANEAAANAAGGKTWFIPNSPFWSQTSDEVALQTALSDIATGKDVTSELTTAQTTILTDINAG